MNITFITEKDITLYIQTQNQIFSFISVLTFAGISSENRKWRKLSPCGSTEEGSECQRKWSILEGWLEEEAL